LRCALIVIFHSRLIQEAYSALVRNITRGGSGILDEGMKKHLKLTKDLWRTDEVYTRIEGKNAYLYRTVDSIRKTIDFYVSERRDKNAATELAILEERYFGDMSCRTQVSNVQIVK